MTLLGPHEKNELEALILERLGQHFDVHGAQSLLEPGTSVAVGVKGVSIVPAGIDLSDALAHVEVRTLFTAVCLLSADAAAVLPRDSLPSLAKEAANDTATQINRITKARAGP